MILNQIFVAAALLVIVIIVRRNIYSGAKCPAGAKPPPGPKGKLFIGNLLDIPPHHSWLKFKEWADRYGPLFRLNIAGREHYVVSTEKIANDLLRERGTLYSGREQTPAAAQLLGGNLRPLLLPYNGKASSEIHVWRRGRRLMHHLTMATAAARYEPTQVLESTRLLYDLIRSPKDYETWFERYSSGLIFRLGFGKTIETGKEDYVRRIMKVVHTVERVASPGAYLVDTFPALMYIPKFIAPFKQELGRLHEEELSLFRQLLEDVRREMNNGKAPECWERRFLENKEDYGLADDEGAYVVGTLFEAGSGTTAAAMMSFILAMVHHPQWQKRVQDEVDGVTGDKRLPGFDDMPNLPVVRAVVKEVLRWRPVTAGGVPHQLVKDDVYNGFFLPAGTNVHANQWAIHRDPDLYPEPEIFNPDRWLSPEYPTYREPITSFPNLQNFSAFGFGRRICPGQNIAERSLNLLTARIAWACQIQKARDAKGEEIEVPWYDYTTGFNVQPKWFNFDLRARSEERKRLVEEAMKEAKENDPLAGRK